MSDSSNNDGRVEAQEQIERPSKSLVSLVVPVYNEAQVIENNLSEVCDYMKTLENQYSWELIVVNDGSKDESGNQVEAFARNHSNVKVVHHKTNLGLGQALRTGFEHCLGEYIITLDGDLSYAPDDHIERLLKQIRTTWAKIVVASPYSVGGQVSNVPQLRRFLSVWANRFLFVMSGSKVRTLTGMVRVYDARFVRSLNLTAMGMEINPEVIYKTKLLNGQIEEIPAHLQWRDLKIGAFTQQRQSSMKILQHTGAILRIGFLFRPALFFWLLGTICFLLGGYALTGIVIDGWTNSQTFPSLNQAISVTFQQTPVSFLIVGLMLLLTIQFVGLGVLSRQTQTYFEELFCLGTKIYQATQEQNSQD